MLNLDGKDSASRAKCQIYLSISEAQPIFAPWQRYKKTAMHEKKLIQMLQ